jgi:hypothetical protein
VVAVERGQATTMKNSSTVIFVITMTVFERADWRTPAISTPAHEEGCG